eukprot:m51a1_g1912 hypothetical protein (1004) ;mRNA; r:808177-813696
MGCDLLRTVVLIAAVAAAALSCDVRCQWTAWKSQYGKAYTRNAEPGQKAVYGPGKFSDLTWDEFSAKFLISEGLGSLRKAPARAAPDAPVRRAALPESFISPYTLPARQQGTCGSCWAFTSAAVMEGAMLHATGHAQWVSPQNLLDCVNYGSATYNGCQGFRPDLALAELTESGVKTGGGPLFDVHYQYAGRVQSCQHSLAAKGNVTVTSYFTERFDETEGSSLYQRLVQYGPLGIGFNSRNLDGYKSGIVVPTEKANCLYTSTGYFGADHAVTLVGWGVQNGVKYWVIKNSWGADWGEPKDYTTGGAPEGYFRILRGANACHIAEDVATGAMVAGESPASGAQPCSPKLKSEACGARQCGGVDNGCGNTLTCGFCGYLELCSNAGFCIDNHPTDWVQVPNGTDFFFDKMASGAIAIDTTTDTAWEKRAMWTTSGQWTSEYWTSFSVGVKLNAAGTIGLGMRMGQPESRLNGIAWKIKVPYWDGADTTMSYIERCFFIYGNDQCMTVLAMPLAMKVWHNFTVNFALQGGDAIAMRPYLNGNALLNGSYHWIPRSFFPKTGSAFVLASGAWKHFSMPAIITRTTVHVAMTSCHTTGEWASQVARILRVPREFIVDVSGARKAGSACGSDKFDSFNVTLLDSNATVGMLGQASVPVASIPQTVYSNALAQQLTQAVAGGGLENMGIAGATAEVVAPTLSETAVAATIAGGTSAALSTGAIVGIAVGGSVAALAVVGAGVGTGVYVAKRRQGRAAEPKAREDQQQPKSGPRGVDVMSNTQQHQSISGPVAERPIALGQAWAQGALGGVATAVATANAERAIPSCSPPVQRPCPTRDPPAQRQLPGFIVLMDAAAGFCRAVADGVEVTPDPSAEMWGFRDVPPGEHTIAVGTARSGALLSLRVLTRPGSIALLRVANGALVEEERRDAFNAVSRAVIAGTLKIDFVQFPSAGNAVRNAQRIVRSSSASPVLQPLVGGCHEEALWCPGAAAKRQRLGCSPDNTDCYDF